ncbi:MAG: winged helix-turn-helix transcriptional regulator [Rhizobiaceae bacterium]|nr:winged helix-turn-helix transcriptional regulator [Rhizobiaceae bacterium]
MTTPSATALADLLELLARMLHARGYQHEMFPAQWVALRYFSRARRDLCTASELARFQGMANGPVSRTVRTLLHKGLLTKAKDQPRGKAEILELTTSGRALLRLDPCRELESILSSLGDDARVLLADTLETLIHRLALPSTKTA